MVANGYIVTNSIFISCQNLSEPLHSKICSDLHLRYCVCKIYMESVLAGENLFVTNRPLKDLLFLCSFYRPKSLSGLVNYEPWQRTILFAQRVQRRSLFAFIVSYKKNNQVEDLSFKV